MAETVVVHDEPLATRGNTAGLISAFYVDSGYLLDRVERSSTHYQTLGVDRGASTEQINEAYENTVVQLQPAQKKVRDALPDEMRVRIAEAFAKVSEAYDVLVNTERRAAYDDGILNRRSFIRLQPISVTWSKGSETQDNAEEQAPSPEPKEEAQPAPDNGQTIDIRFFHEQERAYVKVSKEPGANLRRCERFKLSIPALVTGYEPGGTKWKEVTKTIDVSRVGAGVRMTRKVKHGAIVHVTLPLPTRLRSHGFTEPGYNTYAIVRRILPPKDGARIVGLEFIGAQPPGDFLKRPWATFKTQKWVGPDRRREPREIFVERVEVEYLNASQETIGRETAITESISPSGSRIRVKQASAEIEWLRIKSSKRGFESIALVRNQYTGKDGIERLCLEFIESKFPVTVVPASDDPSL